MATMSGYDAALRRAQAEQCEIVNAQRDCWDVWNPKNGLAWYTVEQPRDAFALSCNCPAGNHGQYCKHRALVHHALATRATLPRRTWVEIMEHIRARLAEGVMIS